MKTKVLFIAVLSVVTLMIDHTAQAQRGGGGGRGGAGGRGANHPQRNNDNDGPGDGRSGGKEFNGGRWDPGVNQRQENQAGRIGQGIRSGQLTKDETQGIREDTKAIRQEEKEYKSDGKFTVEERKDVHQDLNAVSKEIYQEKHDAETRNGVTPAGPKTLGTKDPNINARQANQQNRIQQGVQSGELTKPEAGRLAFAERRVAAMEKRLKEDGNLSVEERARMQAELKRLNQAIYNQKHDAQTTDK